MLNKCIFAHLVDGQPHVFSPREIKRLKIARRLKRYSHQKKVTNTSPIDERTQRLIMARQERNRRRQVESRRASERISQRNETITNQPTTSTRPPTRPVTTAAALETLAQRNSQVVGALVNAESRAAAAELRLASIQSNVNQLRVLLDQFQERAIRATRTTTTTTATGTTTPVSGSADTVELSRDMVEIGHRMARNTRGTRGHGRRVRDTTTPREPTSLEDMPGITIIPPRVIPRTTTQPRTSMEDVREMQGSPQRIVPRMRMEPINSEDVPGTTAQPLRMEDVDGVRVVPRARAEQRRIEENLGVQVVVQQPVPGTNTNGSGNAGSSGAVAAESGIDPMMAEIRSRQWEELRRRLASRLQRSQ